LSEGKKHKEGWGFPGRGNKAHYFLANGMSLCNKWGFYKGPTEQGNDDSSDNCTACKKALQKRKAKEMVKKLKEGEKISY